MLFQKELPQNTTYIKPQIKPKASLTERLIINLKDSNEYPLILRFAYFKVFSGISYFELCLIKHFLEEKTKTIS
jgi:hypothetical protein